MERQRGSGSPPRLGIIDFGLVSDWFPNVQIVAFVLVWGLVPKLEIEVCFWFGAVFETSKLMELCWFGTLSGLGLEH